MYLRESAQQLFYELDHLSCFIWNCLYLVSEWFFSSLPETAFHDLSRFYCRIFRLECSSTSLHYIWQCSQQWLLWCKNRKSTTIHAKLHEHCVHDVSKKIVIERIMLEPLIAWLASLKKLLTVAKVALGLRQFIYFSSFSTTVIIVWLADCDSHLAVPRPAGESVE